MTLGLEYIPKETYHDEAYAMHKGYNEYSPDEKQQEQSPELIYNYQDGHDEDVYSSEGESGFTSFDSI
jgi:hypothetical protein